MSRWLKYVAAGALTVYLGLAGAWYWALHTDSGAQFVWRSVQQNIPGNLQSADTSGNFAAGFIINQPQFNSGGMDIAANRIAVSVDLNLLPLSAEISSLLVVSPQIQLRNNPAGQTSERIDLHGIFEGMHLPIPVRLAGLTLTDLGLTLADSSNFELIANLELAAELHESLIVERLHVESRYLAFDASGSLLLQEPFATRLELDGRITDVGIDGINGLEITAALEGDNNELLLELQSAQPNVTVSGVVSSVLNDPEYKMRVSSPRVAWPIDVDTPAWTIEDVEIAIDGNSTSYRLQNASAKVTSGSESAQIEILGNGTMTEFIAARATLKSAWLDIQSTGEISWAEQLRVNFAADVDRFDPVVLIGSWPAEYPVQGTVRGNWQGQGIELSDLNLAIAGTGTEIAGIGKIDADAETVDGALTWKELHWPLGSSEPVFLSSAGDVSVAGNLSEWVVDGDIKLIIRDLPEGDLQVRGDGNRDGVRLAFAESAVFGGLVKGTGAYSWRDRQVYDGSLSVAGILPGTVFPQWPGVLSGGLEIKGSVQDESISIGVADVNGELRGAPISATGRVVIAPNEFAATDLKIVHGNSRIDLDGSLYERDGIHYRVNLPGIGQYSDSLDGMIEGTGYLSLSEDAPRVRANLSGRGLEFANHSINSFELNTDPDDDNAGFINQRLLAEGLRVYGREIEKISASVVGNEDDHELQIEASTGDAGLALRASGALSGLRHQGEPTWTGVLQNLRLDYQDDQFANLRSPIDIVISARNMGVGRGCLVTDEYPLLCADATWQRNELLDISAELLEFPLGLLNRFVETNVLFSQTVSGQLRILDRVGQESKIEVSLGTSPGQMSNSFDEELTVETGQGVLAFAATDYELGSGTFDMAFPGNGDVDIEWDIEDLASGLDSGISGRVQVNLDNIRTLTKLIPFIESSGGRLDTDLNVGGTLAEPIVNGRFMMRDATLRYPPLGTRLENVQVEASITGNNKFEMDASFSAGAGRGHMSTSAAYESGDDTNFELEFQGKDLLLVDLPELRVVAEPNFSLSVRNNTVIVGGAINIPEAYLKPTAVPQAQLVESDDVVVIAGELPESKQQAADANRLAIGGDLQVTLGKNVSIDLDVAKANLGGAVNYAWRGDWMPIANGSYSIDGSISALGQVLTISKGSIRFSNVPANDPYLNISAEREIFGNSQVKTAGVLVTGSAKSPVIEAYTYPLTTEERALTLLATGSDFDYEQGVGALDFGTYIAPRLFLSYGVGLFERDNVFSVRYDITTGFGIKASSGQQDAGIDLSYRIDN